MDTWTLTETEALVQRLESAEARVAILSAMWTREEGCGPAGLCCCFVGEWALLWRGGLCLSQQGGNAQP